MRVAVARAARCCMGCLCGYPARRRFPAPHAAACQCTARPPPGRCSCRLSGTSAQSSLKRQRSQRLLILGSHGASTPSATPWATARRKAWSISGLHAAQLGAAGLGHLLVAHADQAHAKRLGDDVGISPHAGAQLVNGVAPGGAEASMPSSVMCKPFFTQSSRISSLFFT